jgi:hypothetical protein
LPLRAKLHSAIDNLIAHGEMALLRQWVGTSPQPK